MKDYLLNVLDDIKNVMPLWGIVMALGILCCLFGLPIIHFLTGMLALMTGTIVIALIFNLP